MFFDIGCVNITLTKGFTMSNELVRYQKLSIQLKGYLKGRGFTRALEAFQFAKECHPGFRKDGVTPNFQHQIEICLFILTLKEVANEEDVLMAALLHDSREDPHMKNGKLVYVEHQEIVDRFGKTVADAVEKLTKEFKGAKKEMVDYFDAIASCPIASIVKGADRIHNISSMTGVFTIPKQEHYVFEVKEYFLPMLKTARNNFPHQQMSYHAMNTFLKNMCKTVEAVIEAENKFLAINTAKVLQPNM